MGRVLVVDDEPKLGRLLTEALARDGHEVARAQGGRQALVELAASAWDVVVTDLRMPEVDGLSVLEAARAREGAPEVILMTAFATTESAVAAMKAGAADYVTKPFALEELRLRVGRLVSARQDSMVRQRLVHRLTPALVAESPRMREVLAAARKVATSDATVLLLGESGTGKSQLARFLHYTSPRADGPLVEVHCAALPEALLESELFGHVRGAFTGADVTREGHLARAHGGTLFLDEIGEVSPATQVKLLRFLQERVFIPVGSTEARTVDVRVVAATNRDLEKAVAAGTFREDFYWRLNVFSLQLPPLRERREDVPTLAERWLAARGMPPDKLTPEARTRLAAHTWPGNVRELENVLERALILAGEGPIGPGVLALGPGPRGALQAADLLREGFNLDAFERELLHAALDRTGGNKTLAARLLGITRRRLYSRLESLQQKLGEPGEEA